MQTTFIVLKSIFETADLISFKGGTCITFVATKCNFKTGGSISFFLYLMFATSLHANFTLGLMIFFISFLKSGIRTTLNLCSQNLCFWSKYFFPIKRCIYISSAVYKFNFPCKKSYRYFCFEHITGQWSQYYNPELWLLLLRVIWFLAGTHKSLLIFSIYLKYLLYKKTN